MYCDPNPVPRKTFFWDTVSGVNRHKFLLRKQNPSAPTASTGGHRGTGTGDSFGASASMLPPEALCQLVVTAERTQPGIPDHVRFFPSPIHGTNGCQTCPRPICSPPGPPALQKPIATALPSPPAQKQPQRSSQRSHSFFVLCWRRQDTGIHFPGLTLIPPPASIKTEGRPSWTVVREIAPPRSLFRRYPPPGQASKGHFGAPEGQYRGPGRGRTTPKRSFRPQSPATGTMKEGGRPLRWVNMGYKRVNLA